MRILIGTPTLPYPGVPHAGGMMDYYFIRYLSRNHEVHLISLCREEDRSRAGAMRGLCASVFASPVRTVPAWTKLRRMLFLRLPMVVKNLYAEEILGRIHGLLAGGGFDIAQFEGIHMAQYIETLKAEKAAVSKYVFFDHDLRFLSLSRDLRNNPLKLSRLVSWMQRGRTERYEKRLWALCDMVLTLSEMEREVVASEVGGEKVRTVRWCMDVESVTPVPIRREARRGLFVGNFHHRPNVAAVEFLCGRILPRIRSRLPDFVLTVVGVDPPRAVTRWHDGKNIVVKGFTPELGPLYEQGDVFLCPVLLGGGVKGKIVEAMAHGLPVVASSVAVEGFSAEARRVIPNADDSRSYAREAVRVLSDYGLRERLSREGSRLARAYHWERVGPELERALLALSGESACEG